MILCDTNILIEFYKSDTRVINTLKTIGQENFSISVITQAELFYGAKNKTELYQLKNHLSSCLRHSITEDISALFVDLMLRYSLSHKVTIPDMLIAATAITHKIQLYTLNIKDFNFIPELSLYTPKV